MRRLRNIIIATVLSGFAGNVAAQEPCVFEQEMDWLIGEWRATAGKTEFIERWSLNADGEMVGYAESRSLEDGNRYTFENMRLEDRDGSSYYVARVNDAEPIAFRMIECTANSVKFENPEHDFPNLLHYSKTGPETFTASVSDLNSNGFELNFERTEAE